MLTDTQAAAKVAALLPAETVANIDAAINAIATAGNETLWTVLQSYARTVRDTEGNLRSLTNEEDYMRLAVRAECKARGLL